MDDPLHLEQMSKCEVLLFSDKLKFCAKSVTYFLNVPLLENFDF